MSSAEQHKSKLEAYGRRRLLGNGSDSPMIVGDSAVARQTFAFGEAQRGWVGANRFLRNETTPRSGIARGAWPDTT